jgi:hypothetical protein
MRGSTIVDTIDVGSVALLTKKKLVDRFRQQERRWIVFEGEGDSEERA